LAYNIPDPRKSRVGEVQMNFLSFSPKFKAMLWAVATTRPASIRSMSAAARVPYETARRALFRLSCLKEAYARFVLERYCPGEDVALVVIDPTYLKELVDGILVAGLLVPGLRRCVPLYWEHFNWRKMEERENGLYSRNLFQRRFIRRLKELVYPRKLVIIADREFGRLSFLKALKKAGISWVIRVPKNGYPPRIGEHILFQEPGHDEPWLLSFRLPSGYDLDPVKLYSLRMRIEETFRDAKSLLAMRTLLNRIKHDPVREGLILLLFVSWLLLKMAKEASEKYRILPQGLINLVNRGYYSDISFGRLWLCACATMMLEQSPVLQELMGG